MLVLQLKRGQSVIVEVPSGRVVILVGEMKVDQVKLSILGYRGMIVNGELISQTSICGGVNDSIAIDAYPKGTVEVKICEIRRSKVRLGFVADISVPINRFRNKSEEKLSEVVR